MAKSAVQRRREETKVTHRITREWTDVVCSCGLRWSVNEPDPHPRTAEEYLAEIRKEIKKATDDSI